MSLTENTDAFIETRDRELDVVDVCVEAMWLTMR